MMSAQKSVACSTERCVFTAAGDNATRSSESVAAGVSAQGHNPFVSGPYRGERARL
jgi:hypothetical protein